MKRIIPVLVAGALMIGSAASVQAEPSAMMKAWLDMQAMEAAQKEQRIRDLQLQRLERLEREDDESDDISDLRDRAILMDSLDRRLYRSQHPSLY